MIRYIIVSIIGGLIFATLDGIINANPIAQKLFECYKPISKETINIPIGIAVDLIYGFLMCGIFLILYTALPADSGITKGLIYGMIMWFFRVLMIVMSSFVMYNIPLKTLLYIALSGLIEMVLIGLFYGLTINHSSV